MNETHSRRWFGYRLAAAFVVLAALVILAKQTDPPSEPAAKPSQDASKGGGETPQKELDIDIHVRRELGPYRVHLDGERRLKIVGSVRGEKKTLFDDAISQQKTDAVFKAARRAAREWSLADGHTDDSPSIRLALKGPGGEMFSGESERLETSPPEFDALLEAIYQAAPSAGVRYRLLAHGYKMEKEPLPLAWLMKFVCQRRNSGRPIGSYQLGINQRGDVQVVVTNSAGKRRDVYRGRIESGAAAVVFRLARLASRKINPMLSDASHDNGYRMRFAFVEQDVQEISVSGTLPESFDEHGKRMHTFLAIVDELLPTDASPLRDGVLIGADPKEVATVAGPES